MGRFPKRFNIGSLCVMRVFVSTVLRTESPTPLTPSLDFVEDLLGAYGKIRRYPRTVPKGLPGC